MTNAFTNPADFPSENPVPWTVQGTTQYPGPAIKAYTGAPSHFSTPALAWGWTVQQVNSGKSS